MVLKCKMCGGDLNIEEGMTVCECEYCNTKQTVPAVDDEKKIKLFERANRFRMECQFDKAASVYESIIEEFDSEAEGYWGNLLCKYGIEYVDDPATGDKVPTCHRSSFDSFMDDKDFESVMDYADSISRSVYREQAKQIEEIRKGIIEVSGREEPYDIFICYKETAEDGQRTLDSVLAQDIYEALTDKGYRVFFSRITLEDKLGTEYEPYIFAALNSAKVMLAFGTTYDYYNAVWVKNEWSRYLKLMAKDKTKHLIPCYKDIDAYDIPKEFAKLQAQDLGKVGATQDLLRGIEKIIGSKKKEVVKETVVVQSGSSTSVDKKLERGHLALEDDDWGKADSFFEEALNQNPKCAEAYLGKLLAETKCVTFDDYKNALIEKYADANSEKLTVCDEGAELVNASVKDYVLEGYLYESTIKDVFAFDRSYDSSLSCRKSQKNKQLSEIENDKLLSRVRQYATGDTKKIVEDGLAEVSAILDRRISDAQKEDADAISEITGKYKTHLDDAYVKVNDLRVAADKKKYSVYESYAKEMTNARTANEYSIVRDKFLALKDYKNAAENAQKCQSEIDKLTEKKKKDAAIKTRRFFVVLGVVIVCAIIVILTIYVFVPNYKYNQAVKLMNDGRYDEAITAFEGLHRYKDSEELKVECEIQILSNLSKGDSFYFGSYDNEPLEWTILDIQGDQVLAITTNAVDEGPYNNTYTDVTWSSCSLRTWLNNDFYSDVFSLEEQTRIMTTTVSPGNNPKYDTNAGSVTEDRVFLLSIDEVNQYFSSDSSRVCEYDGKVCVWWLRSPGEVQRSAASVNNDGLVRYGGISVDGSDFAVRPALWINLES